MDAEDAEVHVEPYNIPSDKLYGVVELVIDKPNEEGETDVETYVTPAASNWLRDVKREESDDGQTRYFANCLWPRNESKLSSYLEKRSKPADDWVVHSYVRILKFCRSIGQAKEQTKLALENATLLDSDVGLGKRLSLPPPRFGFGFGFSNLEDHRKTSASDTDDEPPPIRGLKVAQAASITRLGRNKRSHHHSDDDNDQRKSVKKSVISSSDSDTEDKTPKENPVSEPSSTGTKNPENGLNLKKVSPNKEIDSDIMTTPKRNKDTNVCAARKTASFSPNKMKLMSSSHLTHFTLMREIKELNKSLNSIKIAMNKIYNCVCPVVEKLTDKDDDRGMPALPVNSFQEMVIWEAFLKDHDNTLHSTSSTIE